MKKTRYVQVGLGGRAKMFRDAILNDFHERNELLAVCDRNAGRAALAIRQSGRQLPGYGAEQFEQMIREQKPDCVIVTTMDATHDDYLCRAMELGCDVMTEKPMTIDATKCRRILDTQRKTGKKVTVTFNYRYAPFRSQVKDMLMKGVIGDVLSVDFHWLLDTHHGADYFRRWHRKKANSGGLMVHKATHHFDLVNWWLGTVPERVYATGARKFYTPATGDRLGLKNRGERCHGCPEAKQCMFYLDIAGNESLKQLYFDCEKHDGYFRDRCVFSPDMDIEDTMSVAVDYANGAKLSYSLNAYCSWEGYIIAFNGTKGRIEHKCEETVYVNGDGTVPGALKKEGTWTRVYPLRDAAYQVELWPSPGGHGGADPVMLKYLFDATNQPVDEFKRSADHRGGAWSVLTGIAANQSIATGQSVWIADLVPGVERP